MNDFTEKFKTYSNTDLLKIIEIPDDYQPLAVETAKIIFSSRQLSEEDIENAKADLESQRQEKEIQTQKKRNLENKVKNIADSFIETINPIQTGTPSVEKIILIISIVFGGLFLFQVYKEFGMLTFIFTDSGAKWDFSMVLYFFPLILVPTAAYLFYKRRKIGWILLAIFLTYSAVSAIFLFFLTLNTKPSGIPALDNFFPKTSPSTHVLIFLFFGGTLWFICKNKIREVYHIDKKTMITTIVLISSITALTSFGLFI